jgi:hypothetical protein
VTDSQYQHLLQAVQLQQRALGILAGGAKLSHQGSAEFSRVLNEAATALIQAHHPNEDTIERAEAVLALR